MEPFPSSSVLVGEGACVRHVVQNIITLNVQGDYGAQDITMTKDEEAIAKMEAMLNEPEPLDVAAEAIEKAGPWAEWTFERQIWYLRVRSDMTQAELSRRSGVSQARISRLEAGGDVKLSTLRTLWAALGYEPLVLADRLGRKREGRPYRKRWRNRRIVRTAIASRA